MAEGQLDLIDPALLGLFLGGPSFDGSFQQKSGADDLAKQGNFTQDLLQILFNPQLAALGGGAQDWMQLGQPYDVEPYVAPAPPVVLTPYTDAFSASQDPTEKAAADAILAGATPQTVLNTIRQSGGDDVAKRYERAIEDMFKEQNDARQAQQQYQVDLQASEAEYGAKTAGKASPLEEMYRKAGLPLPTEQYTADYLDPTLAPRREAVDRDRAGADALLDKFNSYSDAKPTAPAREGGARPGMFRLPPTGAPAPSANAPVDRAALLQNAGVGTPPVDRGALMSGMAQSTAPTPAPARPQQGVIRNGPSSAWGPQEQAEVFGGIKADMYQEALKRFSSSRKADRKLKADEAKAAGRSRGMRESGKSPTSDAIAQRVMMARMLGMGV
jgi:hypothetical protein